MNKKLFGFAFTLIIIFSGLIFSSFVNVVSAAAPVLSVSSLSKNSVILKAVGFSPKQTFSIIISNNPNVSTTPSYSESPSVTASNTGEAQATFIGLTPGGSYSAYTSATMSNPISFNTYLDLTSNKGVLTSRSVGSDTVTLLLSGAMPNESYDIYVSKDPAYSDNNYLKQEQFKTNSTGSVDANFTGLTENAHYIAKFKPISDTSWSDLIYIKTNFNSSALNGMITTANTALENAVGGSANGEYPYASIQTLKDAVAKAEYINGDISAFIQSDIDKATNDLKYALDQFELSKIGGVLNTSELIGMITEANRVLSDAKDADYPKGAKDTLSTAISKADGLDLTSTSITQTDVDDTLAGLESALNTFQSSKIVAIDRSKNTGQVVPKCNTGAIDPATGQYKNPCNFEYLLILINNVIKFLLFTIATPFIALILVYAGWLYLSSSASPKNIDTAKTIFKNAIFGYVLALAAWLIVHTIMTSLSVSPDTMYLTFIINKMFV